MECVVIRVYLIFIFIFYLKESNESKNNNKKAYHGYQVLRIMPKNLNQIKILKDLESELHSQLDFWTSPSTPHQFVDVMLSSETIKYFRSALEENKIPYSVMIKDVNVLIPEEPTKRTKRTRSTKDFLSQYHQLNELYQYLIDLATLHSTIVKNFSIGTSFEGREVKVIQIGIPAHDRIKPAIWIDGGFHAREWITSATVLFLIAEIINSFSSDIFIQNVLHHIDFYLLPVANPDGYEYTWSMDRLWRKTRSNNSNNEELYNCEFCHLCRGTDLNRNWDIEWEGNYPENAALRFPCSPSYRGPYPFSEFESTALASFLLQEKQRMKVYISLHSYSQLWLIPYGYTDKKPEDYSDLLKVADLGAKAIKSLYGTQYKVGRPGELLYDIFGGSLDWVKAKAGIKYAYNLELRDTGQYGFLLPEDQILPTGQELWEALKVIIYHALENNEL